MVEQRARERQQEARAERLKERDEQCKQLKLRTEKLRALQGIEGFSGCVRARFAVKSEKWDRHPWLLGTRQGVIDLRTGIVRPGQPEDHLRIVIPTVWKGLDEPAPRFQRFLCEIFEDRGEAEREELIAYLQRALGYGLTGNVHERIFLMLSGEEGGGGRDTLIHVLEHVLGKIVSMVSGDAPETGGAGSGQSGEAGLVPSDLQGKRIVWINESGACLSPELLKQLTGGTPLPTRQLYSRAYSFQPVHLLILLTARRPEADASDSAFWERLCPLVFNLRFVEQPEHPHERQRDPELIAALEAEASGILAWLVRGTLEWLRLGLAIPASVLQARQKYRYPESTMQDFVAQCCHCEAEARVPVSQLYRRYKVWASGRANTPLDSKEFSKEIKQLAGVTWQHSRRGNYYRGLRLRDDLAEDD